VHVFISYSESSPWSAATARNLHQELAELRVTSFLRGVFGSFVVWPAIAAILWLKFHGNDPVAWLVQHHLLFASFVLAAYWLGFMARLAVRAWFELRYRGRRKESVRRQNL